MKKRDSHYWLSLVVAMVSIDAFESRNQPLSDGVWAVGIEPVDVEELMSQWGGTYTTVNLSRPEEWHRIGLSLVSLESWHLRDSNDIKTVGVCLCIDTERKYRPAQ